MDKYIRKYPIRKPAHRYKQRALYHNEGPKFYETVCRGIMHLPEGQEKFIKLVDTKRLKYSLGLQAAEIEVAVDLFIKLNSSSPDKALLALLATSCHPFMELLLVTSLLQRGADVNIKSNSGSFPLQYAVRKGRVILTEKLLENGAIPSQTDNLNTTCLDIAISTRNDIIASLLLKYMESKQVRKLFIRSGKNKPRFCFQKLIEIGAMKGTVLAVLDALIEPIVLDDPEKAVMYYSVLESDRKGFTPDKDGFTVSELSPLHLISRSANKEYINHAAVSLLLDRKWKCFARTQFIVSGVLYVFVLMFLTASAVLSLDCPDPSVYNIRDPADVTRAMCELIVVSTTIYSFVHEIIQLFSLRLKYFSDPYNYIDLTAAVLVIILIPLRLTKASAQWGIYSLAYLVSVMRVLKFSAMFRHVRTYARIMYFLITKQISGFLVMFLLVSLAFTGSFSLGLRLNGMLSDSTSETSTFWRVFVIATRIALEDDPTIKYYDSEGFVFGWYNTILLAVYLFVVLVMLLNLIIAQLTDIFKQLRCDAEMELQINRAFIVTRVELNSFSSFFKTKKYRKKFYLAKEKLPQSYLSKFSLKANVLKNGNKPSHVERTFRLNDVDAAFRSIYDRLEKLDESTKDIAALIRQYNEELGGKAKNDSV